MIPRFSLRDQKSEFIILVDRSGSMEGESIRLAQETLLVIIHFNNFNCYDMTQMQ